MVQNLCPMWILVNIRIFSEIERSDPDPHGLLRQSICGAPSFKHVYLRASLPPCLSVSRHLSLPLSFFS